MSEPGTEGAVLRNMLVSALGYVSLAKLKYQEVRESYMLTRTEFELYSEQFKGPVWGFHLISICAKSACFFELKF